MEEEEKYTGCAESVRRGGVRFSRAVQTTHDEGDTVGLEPEFYGSHGIEPLGLKTGRRRIDLEADEAG